jgi:hypothetical protein
MDVWKGWTAASANLTNTALTWGEWSVRQQANPRVEPRRPQDLLFSEKELSRLSFLRWLYQTGCFVPSEHDNT